MNAHARWCSGSCPRWLATDAPTCLPTPCRCADTKATAPEWLRERGDTITCWWRKKTTGALTSRCPCWGDSRDGKPAGCCAHHDANPRYLDDPEAAYAALADPEVTPAFPDPADLPPVGWHAPHERADWDDGEPWGPDPAREVKPYVRRWPKEQLTCACPTPWDHKKGPGAGVHCPEDGCHQNFANTGTAAMHRKRWTEPCTRPEVIVDVDTGVALLRLSVDGVWSIDWTANTR